VVVVVAVVVVVVKVVVTRITINILLIIIHYQSTFDIKEGNYTQAIFIQVVQQNKITHKYKYTRANQNIKSPPPHGAIAPSGLGPPHYQGSTITLRHTAIGRTPLGK
jgi:hypothetical protein